jgi:hypothetical protein
MTAHPPRLGLILMDQAHARASGSADPVPDAEAPPWSYTLPGAWPVPWRAVVAAGAGAEPTLAGDAEAVEAIVAAARELEPDCRLLLGNCGFFWAARARLRESVRTPVLLSSLDLLDFALAVTAGRVGVLTFDRDSLAAMLARHPGLDRLRLLGLSGLPQWSLLADDDYWERDGWSVDGLRVELRDHLATALAEGGCLGDVGLLVLECTILPYYRPDLRAVTDLPMIDASSIARALLD